MCQNLTDEFRHWSLVHFIFDAGLTTTISLLWGIAWNMNWWQSTLLALGVLTTVTSGIAIWLRRNEGIREARAGEKGGIRQNIENWYQDHATAAREVSNPEEAASFRNRLLAGMEVHASDATLQSVRELIDDIDNRTDWEQLLDRCAARLEAIGRITHYSDIKRLPEP